MKGGGVAAGLLLQTRNKAMRKRERKELRGTIVLILFTAIMLCTNARYARGSSCLSPHASSNIHTGYFAHVGTPTLTTSAFRDSLGTLSAGDESSLGAGSGP